VRLPEVPLAWRHSSQRSASSATVRVRLPRCSPGRVAPGAGLDLLGLAPGGLGLAADLACLDGVSILSAGSEPVWSGLPVPAPTSRKKGPGFQLLIDCFQCPLGGCCG
jgi:hypothetical protein